MSRNDLRIVYVLYAVNLCIWFGLSEGRLYSVQNCCVHFYEKMFGICNNKYHAVSHLLSLLHILSLSWWFALSKLLELSIGPTVLVRNCLFNHNLVVNIIDSSSLPHSSSFWTSMLYFWAYHESYSSNILLYWNGSLWWDWNTCTTGISI